MPTRDKLNECYDVWLRATDQHKEMMTAVMNGGALNERAMRDKLAELARLHHDWMDVAKRYQAQAR